MSTRDRRRSRRTRRTAYEDVNPLNYVSNLSDVMLILAVGIMLALVLHWDVPVGQSPEAAEEEQESTVTFSDNDLDEEGDMPDSAVPVGDIYYDEETGTYYIQQDMGGE